MTLAWSRFHIFRRSLFLGNPLHIGEKTVAYLLICDYFRVSHFHRHYEQLPSFNRFFCQGDARLSYELLEFDNFRGKCQSVHYESQYI